MRIKCFLLLNSKLYMTAVISAVTAPEPSICNGMYGDTPVYGIPDKDGMICKPRTQREIAKELKISRSYISRIEKRALEKLRERFG